MGADCDARRGNTDLEVNFSRHLFYVGDEIARTSFLSCEACDEVVRLAEEHALLHGGWTQDDPQEYSQTTTDLEVDRIPSLRAFLLRAKFVPALQSFCMQVFNQSLMAMDDVFIVRYTLESQTALELHTDAGDISFMVALSHPGIDYDGGGTFFEKMDDVVMLQKGEMILFNAKLFHSGVPVTYGRRYLLVGFCYTSPEAANEPGNVALDFTLIGSQQQ